jgi:tRNA 2-thiouridine synthesizing protein C
MAKSLLLICRRAPWGGPAAREALDIALAGGAFDLPISLLFLDDGVFQLQSGQQPAAVQQKDLTANLQALPLFGVEALYASASDLQRRGLTAAKLALAVTELPDTELPTLLHRHDLVITL